MNDLVDIDNKVASLYEKVSLLIEQARKHVAHTVNTTEVYTKYYVGQHIVEEEQQGEFRAKYGQQVLQSLSERLTERFGKGWSVDTLEKCRVFYQIYRNSATVLRKSEKPHNDSLPTTGHGEISATVSRKSEDTVKFSLSWSHYLILMRIEDPNARSFYEIECQQQDWSVRQLSRQVGSSLYERLALSRDKESVMRLAQEGQTIEKPVDIIKNPITLEFLGLKPDVSYTESKLENAIINKMQQFLLELGKGFLFEARQKRFTFDEQHFYVDLVFYNRLLQCYVLVDLKTDKLTHQDLGQMQMYVNYYDRYVKQDFEKPTIGILLCESKNDALVELTLPKEANIYASAYQLYLPDKYLLQSKLRQWIDEFQEISEIKTKD